VSSGTVLTVVALGLATVIALLFRLRTVLDSAELGLRRLAGDVRSARKDMTTAGELAAAVARDAGRSQEALDHLRQLRRDPAGPPR
jgi:hypothetical protein